MRQPDLKRELFILRHAKSDWDSGAPTDFERPLNKRGTKDAPLMGRWMKERGLLPDWIVASPAKRAEETVKAVVKALGFAKKQIHWEQRVYEASVRDLSEVLAAVPKKAERVMLVGHNPGLEELVAYLAHRDELPDPPFGFLKTATLVQLWMPEEWARLRPGCAQLVQIMTPKMVKD